MRVHHVRAKRVAAAAVAALTGLTLAAGVVPAGAAPLDLPGAAGSLATTTTTTTAGPAATAQAAEVPAEEPFVLDDGVTAAVYDYAGAIRESVNVVAPDLDGDGDPEQIRADIIRPAELDGVAEVPVVMDASPYYACCGRGNESELKEYDADGDPSLFPLYYDNWFVPRGYAYVAVDMAGTGWSTGCTDHGGPSDVLSVKAVVDWLNGRATAVDPDTGEPVVADWSTGKTGMIGKSYDGTLANGVAATGVEGLETIVPIGAISSWYDYDRAQGLPFSANYPRFLMGYVAGGRHIATDCTAITEAMNTAGDDASGAHNAFWDERDYRSGSLFDASQVTASVFVVHGAQDTNVDTPNFSRWWTALGEQGVQRKLWLTRLGHVDPFDSDRAEWVDTLHRWFDHELLDIDNGIDDEPAVRVEVAPNEVVTSRSWPVTDRTAKLRPRADGSLALGARGRAADAGWVNAPNQTFNTALAAGTNPNRLLFRTGTLTDDLRLSGAASVTTTVTHGAPTGQITVGLVDYGVMDRVLTSGDGATTLGTESCYGESAGVDDGCYRDVVRNIGSTELQVLGRGWARLDGAGTHTVTVEMQTNDLVVPAGHQLGLVVMGTDRGATVTVDRAATQYSIDLGATTLNLPVSGPMKSFAPGRSLVPEADDVSRSALLPEPRVVVPR
ncbi:Xaa-Pro dipeptidyl-peptidase [Promicromonospora sukumoe]|uniref:X-Pro dipeptidyl-peptidase n=1 Tax=Promicromonospora sukumoe TaxID=88382 RepID=A0A7W3PGW5_9MICO|nr:CocE/NonD family hydrolase [Promicromonospora sukumoe]MBA8811122.1 X-Pro dipeptidyl-peptidase [Promicromonospora sukumoe]